MSGKYRTVCKDGSSDTFTVNCLPETQCRHLAVCLPHKKLAINNLPVTLIFIFPKHDRSLVVNFSLVMQTICHYYQCMVVIVSIALYSLEFPLTCRWMIWPPITFQISWVNFYSPGNPSYNWNIWFSHILPMFGLTFLVSWDYYVE